MPSAFRALFERHTELPTWLIKPAWKLLHRFIAARDRDLTVRFLNYGYGTDDDGPLVELRREDEADRYCIQLYHVVAAARQLQGKRVLEVGCGRGGGAHYVMRYLSPSEVVGLDQSVKVTKRLNGGYQEAGLSFVQGDAEALPFEAGTFDAILNVESSRVYPHVERFFAEVARVLVPGGVLLFADMREASDVDLLYSQIADAGLRIDERENITDAVLRGLSHDNGRRAAEIARLAPRFMVGAMEQFAGVEGSERYESFASGRMQYVRLVAAAPA